MVLRVYKIIGVNIYKPYKNIMQVWDPIKWLIVPLLLCFQELSLVSIITFTLIEKDKIEKYE